MTKLEDAGIFAETTAAGKEDENDEDNFLYQNSIFICFKHSKLVSNFKR